MLKLEKLYNERFFSRRKSLLWRAPIICGALKKSFPEVFRNDYSNDNGSMRRYNVVDAGCATGEYVDHFNEMGYMALGIEGSKCASKHVVTEDIRYLDLRMMQVLNFTADICTCFEVAEHIEPEYAKVFIGNLTRIGRLVVMTAGQPGQKGHGHVNCQPKKYWEDIFWDYCFLRSKQDEEKLLFQLEPYKRKKGISGYYHNLMIFRNYLQ